MTRVVINSLEENTFYAQIHIKLADRELTVDSRPSDAIALALRTHAPLFVEESVLEKSRERGRLRRRRTAPSGCASGSRTPTRRASASTKCSLGLRISLKAGRALRIMRTSLA